MIRFSALIALTLTLLFGAASVHAESARRNARDATRRGPADNRKSPHDTVSRRTINGNLIMIVYGRPYIVDPVTRKRRQIWGGVVPYGKIWRLGADEATLFLTQKPLTIGEAEVPAGAYTLFMLPVDENTAQLIVNREIGQWGIDPYHVENELTRIPLTARTLESPLDQFTIEIENGSPTGGRLTFTWDRKEFSVPFTVKQ